MTWSVAYSNRARHDLRSLDPSVANRIIRALDRLATTQRGDVRRVRGQTRAWRLRVGEWRVIFTYESQEYTIRVLRVGHRREAYR